MTKTSKISTFLEFYSKLQAKNTASKKAFSAKLWPIQINFNPSMSNGNKKTYILLKEKPLLTDSFKK